MDILCVGDILADIIIRPVGEITFANNCDLVEETAIKPGGDAMNNSINLAKLGNQVACIGRIGNDILGEYLYRTAERQGVDMSHSVRSENTPHAKSTILINADGNRKFFYYPGSNVEFTIEDVDISLLEQCKILQIGGTFHFPNFDGDKGAVTLLKKARERDVVTSMDVNTDFTGRWNEVICGCYPYLDYFMPSLEQAQLITGTDNVEEMAAFFLQRGVKNVIIKLGALGCYFENAEKAFYCGCYDVPTAETTGAGDAFVAGFLTGTLKGMSVEERITFATACSAFVVQKVGATAGMEDFDTVMRFIRENDPLPMRNKEDM